jgi:anti-anti-sigma factor
MEITFRKKGNAVIFDIDANISLPDMDRLEAFIYQKLSPSDGRAYVNLEKISYISSALLGTFVRIQKTVKEKGINLGMLNASQEVISLFKIMGIIDIFDFVKSEDDIPA